MARAARRSRRRGTCERRRRRSRLHHRRQPPRASRDLLRVPAPAPAFDGHDHAAQAVADGAVALLVERTLPLAVPQARVASVPRALGPAAARLYGDPSRAMRCLGITGTAGQEHDRGAARRDRARAAGEHTGLIGNDGVFVDGVARDVEKWAGTNMPQADQLQFLLAEMRDEGVQNGRDGGHVARARLRSRRRHVVRRRVLHQPQPRAPRRPRFVGGVLPGEARAVRPDRASPRCATNVDDPYGVRVREHAVGSDLDVWTYAVDDARADIGAADVVLGARGTALTIVDRRTRRRRPRSSRRSSAGSTSRTCSPLPPPPAPSASGSTRSPPGSRRVTVVRGRAERVDAGQPFTRSGRLRARPGRARRGARRGPHAGRRRGREAGEGHRGVRLRRRPRPVEAAAHGGGRGRAAPTWWC